MIGAPVSAKDIGADIKLPDAAKAAGNSSEVPFISNEHAKPNVGPQIPETVEFAGRKAANTVATGI
jgi:hypothetical protein